MTSTMRHRTAVVLMLAFAAGLFGSGPAESAPPPDDPPPGVCVVTFQDRACVPPEGTPVPV